MAMKKSFISYITIRKVFFCLISFFLVLRVRSSTQSKDKEHCGKISEAPSCTSSQKQRNFCKDSFELSIVPKIVNGNESKWPCYVRPPPGYSAQKADLSLWAVRRPVLGKLKEKSEMYQLYINHQRWAKIENDYVHILEEGGTAGRAFKNNFVYVKTLLKHIDISQCNSAKAPLMLDMGGGIGSVAAALRDAQGGNGSIRAVTYVLPDENLRLQTIISHRGLPSYVANFNGKVPFPEKSFHIVHCKWCWHHLVGYSKWLKEVNRVMAPGGYFVFTFTPDPHEMLKYPDWDNALKEVGFECVKKSRIIMICQKAAENRSHRLCDDSSNLHSQNEIIPRTVIMRKKKIFERQMMTIKKHYHDSVGTLPVRILNINCEDAVICQSLENHFETGFVMHIGHRLDKGILKELLKQRKIAMFHDWHKFYHVPMYPRSIDIALVGCTRSSRYLLTQEEFWIDIHRLLKPGGLVAVTKSLCGTDLNKIMNVLEKTFFSAVRTRADIVIGTRI